MLLWIREPGPGEGERPGTVSPALARPGTTLPEAANTAQFWLLTGSFFLVALAINGAVAHVVPLLTDHGLSTESATGVMAIFGLATLSGRLLAGFLVDRIYAPYVASVFFLGPVAGFALLATASGVFPAFGVILMGLGLGTEVDLIAFLISRYFGQRAFGSLYGYFFMIFGIGTGVGPFLGGMTFDIAGSYNPALIGAGASLVLAVILINRLGPCSYPAEAHFSPALRPQPAG